jgi:uncharacterized protein
MARKRTGFYQTIEYIGPRPQKGKRPNLFGGWVIIAIALGFAFWFGKPLVPFLKATQISASTEQAAVLANTLNASGTIGNRLAAAALHYTQNTVTNDLSYYQIDYPNGDIPASKGVAADVIVRCYRKLGIDLQEQVHNDMVAGFRDYPGLWNATKPDTNIDHRRIPNLNRFFEHKGEKLVLSRNAADYQAGDVVVWSLGKTSEPHIGIAVPGPGDRSHEMWVVHQLGSGVKWENALFDNKIEGHYRYSGPPQP